MPNQENSGTSSSETARRVTFDLGGPPVAPPAKEYFVFVDAQTKALAKECMNAMTMAYQACQDCGTSKCRLYFANEEGAKTFTVAVNAFAGVIEPTELGTPVGCKAVSVAKKHQPAVAIVEGTSVTIAVMDLFPNCFSDMVSAVAMTLLPRIPWAATTRMRAECFIGTLSAPVVSITACAEQDEEGLLAAATEAALKAFHALGRLLKNVVEQEPPAHVVTVREGFVLEEADQPLQLNASSRRALLVLAVLRFVEFFSPDDFANLYAKNFSRAQNTFDTSLKRLCGELDGITWVSQEGMRKVQGVIFLLEVSDEALREYLKNSAR